jgi:hypothetical protein
LPTSALMLETSRYDTVVVDHFLISWFGVIGVIAFWFGLILIIASLSKSAAVIFAALSVVSFFMHVFVVPYIRKKVGK